MRRREFITLLTGAALLARAARAQHAAKIPVVGILWHGRNPEQEAPFRNPLLKGFADLGFVSGKSIIFEERYADEEPERFNLLAAELTSLKVDVLIAVSGHSAVAAKRATSTIPVVFVGPPDPIGIGVVPSLSRPGGNVTGISSMVVDIASKRIQLFKEVLPELSRAALLYDPNNPISAVREVPETRAAAEKMGLSVEAFEARKANDLDQIFSDIAKRDFPGVILGTTPMFYAEKKRISDLGLKYRLAMIGPADTFVDDGTLMSYGVNFQVLCYGVAHYVDRILRGEKPGDLPVRQPTKFDLSFNLKTARALGLEIPPAMLILADKVIE